MHKTKMCVSRGETLFGHQFRLELLFFFLSPVSVAVHQQLLCHLGEVHGRMKGSLLLSLSLGCPKQSPPPLPPSLSQSSPAGFTFSKYHHSSPGRGAGGGGVLGGYGRGPVTGQCVCPSPLLFSSPQAAKNIGLCHRQQPHSAFTPLTMELQIYSGVERPAPFYCSLPLHPCLLPPSYSAFFLCVALFA